MRPWARINELLESYAQSPPRWSMDAAVYSTVALCLPVAGCRSNKSPRIADRRARGSKEGCAGCTALCRKFARLGRTFGPSKSAAAPNSARSALHSADERRYANRWLLSQVVPRLRIARLARMRQRLDGVELALDCRASHFSHCVSKCAIRRAILRKRTYRRVSAVSYRRICWGWGRVGRITSECPPEVCELATDSLPREDKRGRRDSKDF